MFDSWTAPLTESLINELNLTRFGEHEVVDFFKNSFSKIIAVECNCGKCHKVIGMNVLWDDEIQNDEVKRLQLVGTCLSEKTKIAIYDE